ncbi:similar to Saccharomyces cerevisiae YGR232W NAS6 Proteasome-interacting protein involved in the assembly of the base subcomplex of the 19S proteasomal regulatory particle (RP) [Maudiozyma barnettii]|nr:similar to Saccharomyces cerevisiae YGR232W NAS6 Proteasome-interacting protein involved in the assembly of the base subcomplex of the 19S proteasomal regulatory particle (RP) [Kazachstania barnettii]
MSDYPLHAACMDNKLAKVQEYLQNSEDEKKDIIAKDADNRTALHWAVSSQATEIVTYLLSHMKDIDLDILTDDAGWTPVHIAASVGNLPILKELCEREIKPDLDLKTQQGITALHLAVSKTHYGIVEYLLANGASTRIKDKKGQLPLHRACAIGSTKMATLLCAKLSPINARDNQGWTPLFHALAEGHGDVAVLLVNQYSADKDIQDSNEKTASDVALDDKVRKYFESNV